MGLYPLMRAGLCPKKTSKGSSKTWKLLGLDKPFLYNISSLVIEQSKQAYPNWLKIRKTSKR